jgi:putative transcriptional regulator
MAGATDRMDGGSQRADSGDATASSAGDLAQRIAGEVALSDDPGATLKKWRTEFDVTQTDLAAHLDVSPSVVSDYESGRRSNPGIDVVARSVEALIAIDAERGGERIRRYERVLSAGFDEEVVQDLREYDTAIPVDRVYRALDATPVVPGDRDVVSGHTVIASVPAITRLSSDEFYRLYGQSTSRVLIFTGVSRGESPLVALRVVTPTPNAVVLHGIEEADLWEHATDLASIDGYGLATSTANLDEALNGLRSLP